MDFSTLSETLDSKNLKPFSQWADGKDSFKIKNFNVESKEIEKRASSSFTDILDITNDPSDQLNDSLSKVNNISSSLMINSKVFQKNNCSSPFVLQHLDLSGSSMQNKEEHEIGLKLPNGRLYHSKTFTKSYPNLNQRFMSSKHLTNSYKEKFILKSKDDRIKLVELLHSFNLANKPQCYDQMVDTSDLLNDQNGQNLPKGPNIQSGQFFQREQNDENEQNVQVLQNVIKIPTGNPLSTFSSKSNFNFKNVSSCSNFNGAKANFDERMTSTVTNDLSCSYANGIRTMLNNLLKDLGVHNSNVKLDEIENWENEFVSSKSEFLQIYQDLPKPFEDFCNKVENDNSKGLNYINQKDSEPIIKDVYFGAKPTLSINIEQIAFGIGDPREKLHSNIRIFTLDQFDDLIKSHLSPVDRRIRAISKKSDCNIKISGPYNSFHNRTVANSRLKIVYYCHLISNSKEKGDKCLKCLQDSFPSMRLHEINLSSIYKQ